MEHVKKHKKISVGLLIASIIFGIYALSLVIPLLWGIMISLQTRVQYMTDPTMFPKPPQFINYINAFVELQESGSNMLGMIFNSLWYALGGALINVAASVLAAYVCAQYKFFLNKVMYWISVITMMIPIMGSLPASLKLSVALGLYDSPLTIISSASALGTTFVIAYAFFKGVSWSYAESAFIDGAGHFRVFFQIMLPQAFSPIIALTLTGFIGRWNDAMSPLIYLPSWPTLASGFYVYQKGSISELNYPLLFAGLFIAAIPIMALYIAFQNTLMDLNMGGGLKG